MMKSFAEFKEELLRDPKIRRGYDALGPEFELIAQRIEEQIAEEKSLSKTKKSSQEE